MMIRGMFDGCDVAAGREKRMPKTKLCENKEAARCDVEEKRKCESRVPALVRMPGELKMQLGKEACELGLSFNGYVLLLIHKARQC